MHKINIVSPDGSVKVIKRRSLNFVAIVETSGRAVPLTPVVGIEPFSTNCQEYSYPITQWTYPCPEDVPKQYAVDTTSHVDGVYCAVVNVAVRKPLDVLLEPYMAQQVDYCNRVNHLQRQMELTLEDCEEYVDSMEKKNFRRLFIYWACFGLLGVYMLFSEGFFQWLS